MPDAADADQVDVTTGQPVYDKAGNELGTVHGLDGDGFYVAGGSNVARLTLDRARDLFGRAHVTWSCRSCGEIGPLDGGLPDGCPDCDAPREELYYRTED